jgi:AraC family transcriptional regulator, arabinose operon regulatory protein
MSASPELSPAQRAAIRIYEWYRLQGCGPTPHEALQDWLTDSKVGLAFTPEDLLRGFVRNRDSDNFAQCRQQLLHRWSDAMADNGLARDEATAIGFLRDWLENVDHGMILSQALIAGRTVIREAAPVDVPMSYDSIRSTWILHLTIEGGAIYSSDKDFNTRCGDLLLIDPSAVCYYRRHPDCAIWTHDWVAFLPRHDWSRWMSWPTCSYHIYRCSVSDNELFDRLVDLMEQIRGLAREDQRHHEDLQYNLLEQVLIRASMSIAPATPSSLDPRVERACALIRNNLAAPLTVGDIAGQCSISPSRFAHLFTEAMGVSPQQFRNSLRMQLARKLLATTRLSIAAIAAEVGYSDPSQFSKYFTSQAGCSARDFRRQFSSARANSGSPQAEATA